MTFLRIGSSKPAIAVEPQQPPRPVVQPKVVKPPDELSTGRGGALRRDAVRTLGSTPFSAALPAIDGGSGASTYRLGPDGRLQPSSAPAAVPEASDAVKNEAKDRLIDVRSPNNLSGALRGASPEVRREIIRQVIADGHGDDLLTGFAAGSGPGANNAGYDAMQEVSDAVGEAYRAGDITDEQLHGMLEDMGEDRAAQFISTMAMGANNTGIPGLVEALGTQAESLGYDTAAALAFTSSDALIDAHYPTAEAQRGAFEQVKSYLEAFDQDIGDIHNPELKHATGVALQATARLTARGNGYTNDELDEELKELGSGFVQETISFAGHHDWNGQVPGPLDTLGDAAARLAGDEKDDGWKIASSIAYTESVDLIDANLETPAKREAAFDTLNAYLADSRDEWSLAQRGSYGEPYNLVRAPEANDGITRLLGAHGDELIEAKLEKGSAGEADLVQLFESISLNPYVDQNTRDRVTSAVQGYIDNELKGVNATNASKVGEHVSRLYATLQVAANRAISSADGDEKNDVKESAVNVLSSVTGGLVEAGLTSTTGPLGALIGGAIAEEVVGKIFGSDTEPTRDEIERKVFEQLENADIEVSAGEIGLESVSGSLNATYDAINTRLQTATGDERVKLQNQLTTVQGLINGLNEYERTVLSGQDAGGLAAELNKRKDNANLS